MRANVHLSAVTTLFRRAAACIGLMTYLEPREDDTTDIFISLLEKSAGHCKLLPKALSAQEIINQCRRLSAVSSIEVCHTAISRTDLCTRHSTVQYSTVHRIQYNRFG